MQIRQYPYCAVGTLFATFPDNKDKVHQYTCFLIEANVVVTLASNINNAEFGGKAISVTTSFSNDKISNISYPEEFEKNKLSGTSLAVLLYPDPVISDWLGVKIASNEELSDKDVLLMASLGLKETSDDKSVISGDNSSIDNSSNLGAPIVANSSTTTDGEEKSNVKYMIFSFSIFILRNDS